MSAQIERLRRALRAAIGDDFTLESVDLLELDAAEREAALDAIVADAASPFVFVNGRMVCSGAVDTAAVLGALAG